MVDIKLYSFNVRGIRADVKRRAVFRHLKSKYPGGIYLLQETHSTEDTELKWDLEWKRGLTYYSHGTNDSCGVAVLISPELDISASLLHKDEDGRFSALKFTTANKAEYVICNVYAPTRDKVQKQLEFLIYLKESIAKLDPVNLIIGGDFNTVFDPKLDKQGGDLSKCVNSYTEELVAFMEAQDLIDAIRLQNPEKKIFTRMQRSPPVLSRIDHWLVSSHVINNMKEAKAFPGIKSDHSLIFLNITNIMSNRGRGFWKFNSSLLHDTEYVEQVTKLIDTLKIDTASMHDKQLQWDYVKTEICGFTVKYSSFKNKQRREFKQKLENDLLAMQAKLQEECKMVFQTPFVFN